MSGSWSNPQTSLIILIEQVSGFSGIFGYSPAPGAGNLVFSLTVSAGTDPYGNAYPAGMGFFRSGTLQDWIDAATGNIQIGSLSGAHFQFDTVNDVMNVFDSTGTNETIVIGGGSGTITGGSGTAGHFVITGGSTPTLIFYNSSNQESVKIDANSGTGLFMDNTGLTFSYVNGGRYSFNELTSAGVEPTSTQIADGASISVGGSRMIIESGINATSVDRNVMNLYPGLDNQVTGSVNAPIVTIADFDHNSAVDMWLSGSLIRTTNAGSPYTWTTPTMGTGWANGTGIGGNYPPLRWRYDAEDNIHLMGTFHATSTTPSVTIATGLPSIVGSNVSAVASVVKANAANVVFGSYVSNAGNFDATTLPTIAVNDTFLVNAKVPIGNIS